MTATTVVPPLTPPIGDGGGDVSSVKDGRGDDDVVLASGGIADAVARPRLWWYYFIFIASGFAGLIYQSLWARYVKLFLGHAAYAQVLVLAVFLAGLAIGSALAARASEKLNRPLLVYAAVEAVVALAAVWFHDIFVAAEGWATGFVLPRAESAAAAELFRWTLAAALILPQSVLLGATFPLMSAGLARLRPKESGRIVSLLYFSNSLGAAVGVLASAFVLIPLAGLPGAGIVAGLINALVALAVWLIGRRFDDCAAPVRRLDFSPALDFPPPTPPIRDGGGVDVDSPESIRDGGIDVDSPGSVGDGGIDVDSPESVRDGAAATPLLQGGIGALLLLVAAGTGAASFVYEIVWIRMISLLVGSSSHSFEVMISAFIFGLAVGGWVVRRRAQSDANPLMLLAKVQFVMGALALVSLFVYPHLFEALAQILRFLPKTAGGYVVYLAVGYGFSALMMLPATICAGMTLPLLTKSLMRGGGESAVGAVYAANTAGGIAGAVVAVHFLLPLLGIAHALAAGAALDLALAVILARRAAPSRAPLAAVAVCAVLAPAVAFGGVDPAVAASGVYRLGQARGQGEVLFYRDGKTASVSVFESANENFTQRNIRTNGKVDAGIIQGQTPREQHTGDEMTMTSAALFPLLLRPDAKTAANIGLGSGLTAAALLTSPAMRRVDTIEIEEMMARGARLMGPRVAATFEDPRSNIVIDDAKSFFARGRGRYDIIISEPSNPWISGVANLFSREFYGHVRRALAPGGVFVQWTHFYESSPEIVASKITALAEHFSDFHWYLSSGSDLIVVAVAEGEVPPFSDALFADDGARRFWHDYGYASSADAETLFIGDKKHLMPYLRSFSAPVNSDYFPFVEQRAPLHFFRSTFYSWPGIGALSVPVWEMIGGRGYSPPPEGGFLPQSPLWMRTREIAKRFAAIGDEEGDLRKRIAAIHSFSCPADIGGSPSEETLTQSRDYLSRMSGLLNEMLPQMTKAQAEVFWSYFEDDDCAARLLVADNQPGDYARFWRALSLRDDAEIVRLSGVLLPQVDVNAQSSQIIMLAAMAARYRLGEYQRALILANQFPFADPVMVHAARFIAANAAERL